MSRVVWGHAPEKPTDGLRQTTLNFQRSTPAPTAVTERRLKRESGTTLDGTGPARPPQPLPPPAPAASLDEGILYGPSGGGNRETQRRQRPFMNGQERSAVFDQSPYSRAYVAQWRTDRLDANAGGKTSVTTDMDDEIIVRAYIAPNCPRDLFNGQAFFLNSCDADPLVSIFQLEKIIRYLGGSTTMGPSRRVSYVVTQHLSFAKEEKVRKSMNRGAAKGLPYRLVHPHFVLECAKRGVIVPVAPFVTQVSMDRPSVESPPQPCHIQDTSSPKLLPKSSAAEVIEID